MLKKKKITWIISKITDIKTQSIKTQNYYEIVTERNFEKIAIEFTTTCRHKMLFPVSTLKSTEKGRVRDGIISVWKLWAQFMHHLGCQSKA